MSATLYLVNNHSFPWIYFHFASSQEVWIGNYTWKTEDVSSLIRKRKNYCFLYIKSSWYEQRLQRTPTGNKQNLHTNAGNRSNCSKETKTPWNDPNRPTKSQVVGRGRISTTCVVLIHQCATVWVCDIYSNRGNNGTYQFQRSLRQPSGLHHSSGPPPPPEKLGLI